MIALSEAGCKVWRNNTGKLKNQNGRLVSFGLCVGSADIIGIAPGGAFIAIECKAEKGEPTLAQITFLKAVSQMGGIAGVARSKEDALLIFRAATRPAFVDC